MTKPQSGASCFALATLFGASVGLGACGSMRGSLRGGADDPRAGAPVSAGQPPPPPPSRTPELDADNVERRFGFEEAREQREERERDEAAETARRKEIVVDAGKAAPAPPATPAGYRASRPGEKPVPGLNRPVPSAKPAGAPADAAPPSGARGRESRRQSSPAAQ